VIADAVANDLPELARLMADSDLLRRYRVTDTSARCSLSEAFGAGDTLIVSRLQAVAGFAWLTFAPRMLNRAAYLRLLLVSTESRGRGVGSRLLKHVELRAREHANHLYLLVTTDNDGARAFYERRGYRHVGDLPGLVWADLDEALYYKTLRTHPSPEGSECPTRN
jgi:ribosomal protein S18 acetylase RimI-like enzyme